MRKIVSNIEKEAFQISNFRDRNLINKNINTLKDFIIELNYLKDYIYQNPPDSKNRINEIYNSKIMSSYPKLRELLRFAESKALDNYKEFSKTCEILVDYLLEEVKKMEKERKSFVEKSLKNKE